jgi:hypothetical protein
LIFQSEIKKEKENKNLRTELKKSTITENKKEKLRKQTLYTTEFK